jgi:hypothetical protein
MTQPTALQSFDAYLGAQKKARMEQSPQAAPAMPVAHPVMAQPAAQQSFDAYLGAQKKSRMEQAKQARQATPTMESALAELGLLQPAAALSKGLGKAQAKTQARGYGR